MFLFANDVGMQLTDEDMIKAHMMGGELAWQQH